MDAQEKFVSFWPLASGPLPIPPLSCQRLAVQVHEMLSREQAPVTVLLQTLLSPQPMALSLPWPEASNGEGKAKLLSPGAA